MKFCRSFTAYVKSAKLPKYQTLMYYYKHSATNSISEKILLRPRRERPNVVTASSTMLAIRMILRNNEPWRKGERERGGTIRPSVKSRPKENVIFMTFDDRGIKKREKERKEEEARVASENVANVKVMNFYAATR